MALRDLKETNNKWALLDCSSFNPFVKYNALYIKLGNIDYSHSCIPIKECYQTMEGDPSPVYFRSIFDQKAIICKENIIDWLKVFYPDLRKMI